MDKKGKMFGTLFLIWFIASMIGIIYFAEKNTYYTVMLFGQYFFIFGLIPLFSKGPGK